MLQIKHYNVITREHTLHYEDGELHSHDMSKRGFVVVGRLRQSSPQTPRASEGPTGTPKAPTAAVVAPLDGKSKPGTSGSDAHARQQVAGVVALSPERRRHMPLAPRPPPEASLDATSYYVYKALNRSELLVGVALHFRVLGEK